MGRLFVATHNLGIFPIIRLHGSQIASAINNSFRANESLAKGLAAKPGITGYPANIRKLRLTVFNGKRFS